MRKWKEEINRHFDGEHDGMTRFMDAVARLDIPVSKKVFGG